MKKVLFALFALALVTSICFAEEATAPSSTDNSANPIQVSASTPAPAQASTPTVALTGTSVTTAAPTQAPATTVAPTETTATSAQVPSTTVVPAPVTGSATPSAPAGTTTFSGKVDMVSSGANPQIIVKDDSGVGTTFTVASDATIIGKDGNPTTLNWVSKDDKASIDYITNQDSSKTAKTIRVSASW